MSKQIELCNQTEETEMELSKKIESKISSLLDAINPDEPYCADELAKAIKALVSAKVKLINNPEEKSDEIPVQPKSKAFEGGRVYGFDGLSDP